MARISAGVGTWIAREKPDVIILVYNVVGGREFGGAAHLLPVKGRFGNF